MTNSVSAPVATLLGMGSHLELWDAATYAAKEQAAIYAQTFKAGAALRNITPDPLVPLSSGGIGKPTPSTKKLGDKDVLFLLPFLEIFLIGSQITIFISNLTSKSNNWE